MPGKPIILTLDDDLAVLNAVERDLRRHYGRDYRILKADSGASALETLKELRRRNETVALFLVDQRMARMTGVEFLERTTPSFPDAKRVLLTAYADTEAAIRSINEIGLDYYLMKPWDPPEENLYPALDDLLEEWRAEWRPPWEGIRLAGTLWSPDSHAIKDFLVRHQIPYQWLDVESDEKARTLVEEQMDGQLRIPTLFFPDGEVLVQPDLSQLAERVGLHIKASLPSYDVIIIGGGPAGLAASVYASSEGLKTLLIERHTPGGQAGSSPKIENYLGFPAGITGRDLTRRAMTQAQRFGTEVLSAQQATKLEVRDPYRVITLSSGLEVSARAILLATGAAFNTLNVPGAQQLAGAGVYYGAAHTEAHFYRDREVFVVGGANSAAQGALFLSRYASKVTVLIRGAELDASQYLVDALEGNEKIEILYRTELLEAHGQDRLEALRLRNSETEETWTVPAAAVFVFIGARPQSDLVANLVVLSDRGFILTGPELMRDGRRPKGWHLDRDPFLLETNLPGIFAAGDVRLGSSNRVASAAGEGAIAVALIHQYLRTL